MKRECVTCEFVDGGLCKRYPPTLALWPQDNQHPIMYVPSESYPTVKANDWCGEYATNTGRGR